MGISIQYTTLAVVVVLFAFEVNRLMRPKEAKQPTPPLSPPLSPPLPPKTTEPMKNEPFLQWYTEGVKAGQQLVFTKEKLSFFNGQMDDRPIVLCILGSCYDVTPGKEFYFGQEPYNCFVGRDGTRAFVTGKFTYEDATDDVSDFTDKQWLGVGHWVGFYRDHQVYKQVGTLVGTYFDEEGKPTAKRLEILERIEAETQKQEERDKVYPACNSKFSQEEGTRVWCTFDSGGVQREWQGFPRRKIDGDGSGGGTCVCVPGHRLEDPIIEVFKGCDPSSDSCKLD